jgi:uncharacterized caspase-like protein
MTTLKQLNFLVTALLVLASAAASADGRDEKITNPRPDRTWAQHIGGLFASGKSVAVVVAISNYMGEREGGYPPLRTAKADAEKMVQFLLNDVGFDTIYVITDERATKERIDRLMTDEIPVAVGPNDRFLFYWSGHGDQMVNGNLAFGFLPLAKSRAKLFSTMISMGDISRWDSFLTARHTLFILDSCLSGLAGIEKKGARDVRLDQLSLPAHQLVTAGTDKESVISGEKWTGSLFTDSLILGGRGEAKRSFGIVSLYSLIEFIQDRVAVEKQLANWSNSLTPQIQTLRSGNGAFFFSPLGAIQLKTNPSDAPDGASLGAIQTKANPSNAPGGQGPEQKGMTNSPNDSLGLLLSGAIWRHNDSIMSLSTNGSDVKIYYELPKEQMVGAGVRRGTLLFQGQRSGDQLSGTAYVFNSKCPNGIPYPVSGNVIKQARQIIVTGQTPKTINSSCQSIDSRNEPLVFDRIN